MHQLRYVDADRGKSGALEFLELLKSRGGATAGEDQRATRWSRFIVELTAARQETAIAPDARESHAEAAASGDERQVGEGRGDDVEVFVGNGVDQRYTGLQRGCASTERVQVNQTDRPRSLCLQVTY